METLKEEKYNIKKEYAKRYLLKYIKELKVHFDLNDNEIKEILRSVYYLKTPLYKAIKKLNKIFKEKL